jgi:hypothetical protein
LGEAIVASPEEAIPILTTVSRAERAAVRAAREMARREAELEGRRAHIELKDDGLAITKPELERLMTCHRSTYRKLDWGPMAGRQPVAPPKRTDERERAARRALATYQPSWHERMFGDDAQRRRQLNARVLEASREDEIAYRQACVAIGTYNGEALIARKLLELDPKAVKDAIGLKTRLAELREGMNGLRIAVRGRTRVVALVEAIQEGDVAYERITDGDARSARRELISQADRRQIHLAALCALGLRVGAELVGALPVDDLEVVVACELPDPATGKPTSQPVLQLLMTAKALTELDWKKQDAVTLATKLGARVDWSIGQGFAPIKVVAMEEPLRRTA